MQTQSYVQMQPPSYVQIGRQQVPINWLIFSAAFHRPNTLRWCTNRQPHSLVHCPAVHVAPAFVVAGGLVEPISNFVDNAAKSQLDWCNHVAYECEKTCEHNIAECTFLHRRPLNVKLDGPRQTTGVVRIRDESVPVELLESNPALALPPLGLPVLWCTSRDPDHDVRTCCHAHVRDGYVLANLSVEPLSNFLANRSVQELVKSRIGKLCENPERHDVARCKFLHRVPSRPPTPPSDDGTASSRSNGGKPWGFDPAASFATSSAAAAATTPTDSALPISVLVDGVPCDVADFRPTRGLMRLVETGGALDGVICDETVPHSMADCDKLHLAVRHHFVCCIGDAIKQTCVSGEFVHNAGWQRLQDDHFAEGRLCGTASKHNVHTCPNLHWRRCS